MTNQIPTEQSMFRAFNKRTSEIEYINDLYWFEENGVHSFDDANVTTGDWVFMRPTGLSDKNGTKIFEGDIVKKIDSSFAVPVEFGYKELIFGFITNDNDEFNDYHRILGFFIDDEPLSCPKHLEVIGNIYQNPELLKK